MPDDKFRLNWSTLKYIATSPKLLKYRLEHPQPETPALRLGRAIHCAILEPAEFEGRWKSQDKCGGKMKAGEPCGSTGSLYLDGGWFCKVKGHAPAGAGEPPEGIEVITAEERELVKTCAEAAKAHQIAGPLLKKGHSEHETLWTDPETGTLCRGRLDFIRAAELLDLKSSRVDTVRDFTREVATRLYHGQLAWYHDGAIAAGKLPKDAELPLIVHVSTSEPYDVAVYRLSKITYQAGQILYRDLLQKYLDCQAADWWPGIAPDLLELDLPDWAGGMQGSEESLETVL